MRRVLALTLTLLIILSLLPNRSAAVKAAALKDGDIGFFWKNPTDPAEKANAERFDLQATDRALEALVELRDSNYEKPSDLNDRIHMAREFLLKQASQGIWIDYWGDWAALAVARAREPGEWEAAADHLHSLRDKIATKDFAQTVAYDVYWQPTPTFIGTTELDRALLVAAAVYAEDADALSGFLGSMRDEGGTPILTELLSKRMHYTDGSKVHFGIVDPAAWEANSLASHAYTVIALARVGQLPEALAAPAANWLLSVQSEDGSWGWAAGEPGDPDSTAFALRALAVLSSYLSDSEITSNINHAADEGFAYLQRQLDGKGLIHVTGINWDGTRYDNPSSISTSEVLLALLAWNRDPGAFRKDDTSVSLLGGLLAAQQMDPFALPDEAEPEPEVRRVALEVRGQGRTYFSGTVAFYPDEEANPVTALAKTRLSYRFANHYVSQIEDLAAAGTAGWKYAVNGRVPGRAADDYPLDDGDWVVWFYALSYLDSGGFQEDISLEKIEAPVVSDAVKKAREEAAEKAKDALETLANELNWQTKVKTPLELLQGATLDFPAGSETLYSDEELSYWRDVLSLNKVDVAQKVSAGQEAKAGDELGEVGLTLPAGALEKDETITVKENEWNDKLPLPLTHKLLSHVYSLGPDGINFKEPVTFALKLIVSEDTSAADLVLAYFDRVRQVWRPVPAVLDRANGQILARLTHFSDYAVLKRVELPPSFPDIEQGWDWAKDSISLLALKGVVSGNLVGLFEPERPVTRGEFARFLARTLSLPPADGTSFHDILPGAWYAKDVAACVQAGLLTGVGDKFYPDALLTREQVAVILARALPQGETPELTFADKDTIAPWARAGVARAQAAGLIQGIGADTFAPRLPVSRAQAAVLLVRLTGSGVKF